MKILKEADVCYKNKSWEEICNVRRAEYMQERNIGLDCYGETRLNYLFEKFSSIRTKVRSPIP